jgi:hypothetical protein
MTSEAYEGAVQIRMVNFRLNASRSVEKGPDYPRSSLFTHSGPAKIGAGNKNGLKNL